MKYVGTLKRLVGLNANKQFMKLTVSINLFDVHLLIGWLLIRAQIKSGGKKPMSKNNTNVPKTLMGVFLIQIESLIHSWAPLLLKAAQHSVDPL